MKLQEVKGQYSITIPSAVARLKGWARHDELTWQEDGKGNLLLKKK